MPRWRPSGSGTSGATGCRVCGSIRTQAAHYLQLVTVINVFFGLVAGVVLTLLDVKDAAAYGVIAGLMNFIPIVGALITTGVVLAGGIAEHGLAPVVMLPAAVFLVLHILESQFVTPLLLGRRLLLNPLIVIVGVLVGAAAWGRGGAFLAVPILTSAKIALDAHPRFRRWGQVLGRGALVDCQTDGPRRIRLRRGPHGRPVPAEVLTSRQFDVGFSDNRCASGCCGLSAITDDNVRHLLEQEDKHGHEC